MTDTKRKTNTKRKISFDADRLRGLMKDYNVKQKFLAEKVLHVSYPSLKKDLHNRETEEEKIYEIAEYFTKAKDREVSAGYLKGDPMKNYYFDDDGNVIGEEFIDGETDKDGIPYGEYIPYSLVKSISESWGEWIDKEDKIDYLFRAWLNEDADAISIKIDDMYKTCIGLSNYKSDQEKFKEYGIPCGINELRRAAEYAIKERIKADYEKLALMENYRKKERKTKNE